MDLFNCGGCFTHHGNKNQPGGADGRSSVFPPLMNRPSVKKSIQDLCQLNFLPVVASCIQMSSINVMYRPYHGISAYAVKKEQSLTKREVCKPEEGDSTINPPPPPLKSPWEGRLIERMLSPADRKKILGSRCPPQENVAQWREIIKWG